MNVNIESETHSNAYNKYTSVKIVVSNSDGLFPMFPYTITTGYNYWAITPFYINTFSSHYADENLLDFYISTIDGIEGSLSN